MGGIWWIAGDREVGYHIVFAPTRKPMKPVRRVILAVACVATIPASLRAQQGGAPNPQPNIAVPAPAPAVGLMIEPEIAKLPPVSKFTNGTDQEMGILYGKEKFKLKPGASKEVPIPLEKSFDLKIYEVTPKGMLPRHESKATPNDQKRTIPLDWKKKAKGK